MALDEAAAGWDCHVHVFDAGAPVVPGHYKPVDRPLADIEALAQSHGFGHLVLVQPSVYGSDNSVMLEALQHTPGRHRGVAVVDPGVSAAQLQAMHALGVRGVRFNLVSPVGNSESPENTFKALAPVIRALRWHVQWYARPQDLAGIAALHEGSGIAPVLDHLAGLQADGEHEASAWQALGRLAAAGGWIKMSGWYRLGSVAPYSELHGCIGKAAALFGPRIIWGSDWPHTTFAPDALPPYASLLAPVQQTLVPASQDAVFNLAATRLYA